jgi:predicted RNA-binding protein with PIN domain
MLLIDCYNVLHETMPPVLAGLDEGGLCIALTQSRFRAQEAVVVCDGRPKPLRVSESPVDAVQLVFSGPHRTADDVLITLIEGDSAPRRLTVVSSDREIRKAARRRRAHSMASATFINQLAGSLGRKPRAHPNAKPDAGAMTPHQVQQWLETFGFGKSQGVDEDP